MNHEFNFEGVEQKPLGQFTENAYLNYAMYVIMDRALPSITDGLKPVQRRIIYAMSELGLSAAAKYKKSARTVGDVLGKYHPHGDTACYEAMVLMAQPFSYRYPLVDGQGNWGAPDDPKSFAAMRYTEAKLSPVADVLLGELSQGGTVAWQSNFDGSLSEPQVLPARLPHILLNGVTGIAVGMSTDIPPHNMIEVAQAAVHLIDSPQADLEALMEFVQGPDYPTLAEVITPKKDLMKIYKTGRGSLKMRAVWHRELNDIVISALPHQVSGSKLIEQIANQMLAKKLPMVEDLRDESDHENPIRIVMALTKRQADCEQLMSHLFATTDLEKNYRVNMNMIGLDQRPQVKGLSQILTEWLEYRRLTVRHRLQFRLDKVLARLHLLDALLIAYLNLDRVIEIIRHEDDPQPILMKEFGLTAIQTSAILDTRLRQLAKLEEIKIKAEQTSLTKEKEQLDKLLASQTQLNKLLKKEILADAKKYGDPRRSPIIERNEAKLLTVQELLPVESISVVLSEKGWIRQAKGHDIDVQNLNYKGGDAYKLHARGKSNESVLCFSNDGRCYCLTSHDLPSARTQGEPITGRINLTPDSYISQLIMSSAEQHWLIASDAGYGFICSGRDLISKNRSGKGLINLSENAQVLPPSLVNDFKDDDILVITSTGYLLIFSVDQLPILGKGKGNKIINIPAAKAQSRDEVLMHLLVIPCGAAVTLHAGKRKLNLAALELDSYRGDRGRRGRLLPRGLQKVTTIEVHPE